jgi:hypothetical protein
MCWSCIPFQLAHSAPLVLHLQSTRAMITIVTQKPNIARRQAILLSNANLNARLGLRRVSITLSVNDVLVLHSISTCSFSPPCFTSTVNPCDDNDCDPETEYCKKTSDTTFECRPKRTPRSEKSEYYTECK